MLTFAQVKRNGRGKEDFRFFLRPGVAIEGRERGISVTTVLGLNAYHPDASAALLVDGDLGSAIEEERLNRVKHCAGFPSLSTSKVLELCEVAPDELDDAEARALRRARESRRLAREAKEAAKAEKLAAKEAAKAEKLAAKEATKEAAKAEKLKVREEKKAQKKAEQDAIKEEKKRVKEAEKASKKGKKNSDAKQGLEILAAISAQVEVEV